MCFINLEKALDRMQLIDKIYFSYQRQIPYSLIKTIEIIFHFNKIQVKMNGELTELIPLGSGIRQGLLRGSTSYYCLNRDIK